MNKTRLKEIQKAHEEIEKIFSSLEQFNNETSVPDLRDEEQEEYENMSERVKEGKRGKKSERVKDKLIDASDSLDEALLAVETALNALQSILDDSDE